MARFENKIVGIDLGTTNTLISYYDEIAGRGECCVNREGSNLTPSAVLFENPDSYVVGTTAKDCAIIYPGNTAMYFKRMMGEVKEAITVEGKIFSPQQLSAFVLKSVVEDAMIELEEEIKDVIITVPAYFDSAARQATIEAGTLAGLNVVDIIDEPAAALYYSDSMKDLAGKTVLIFDLGGGTLDLVAAEIGENEINEIEICGNIHLGGMDWDKMLKKYIKEKYLKGKWLEPDDEQSLELAVEKAKKTLTRTEQARIVVSSRVGREAITITRKEFEECTAPLLSKIKETVQVFMDKLLDKGIESFDKIIMVGGASRMPQIDNLLRTIFPDTEMVRKDCDEAVAKGAAVFGKMLSEKGKVLQVNRSFVPKRLNRISARSYGIAVLLGENGEKKICNMIYKSSELPISVARKFYTSLENQKEVNIFVYETTTSERYVDINERLLLGKCVLKIEGDIPKKSEIFVDFVLKTDGTLVVEGKEPKGNTSVRAVMESQALLSAGELLVQKNVVEEMVKQ